MSEPARPDPDLVAYLDGELTSGERRAVEARLADDPQARRQLESLRETFALLDFLPVPEPSAGFATRTLSRLSAVAPESKSVAPESRLVAPKSRGRRRWGAVLAACTVAAVVGVVLERAAGLPRPGRAVSPRLEDLPVIENLPLYWGADDLAFVRRLAESGLFEPAERIADLPDAPADAELPPGRRQELIDLFAACPPPRRERLRSLHRDLHALPAAERTPLWLALEGYAAWVDRLPAADRALVLAADSADARLGAVRHVWERSWRDGLPARRRGDLQLAVEPEERVRLVERWKEEERTRRAEWALAGRHWEAAGAGAKPWPFSDAKLHGGVEEFLRNVLKVDPSARADQARELPAACRLSREEFLELKLRRDAALSDGYWLLYGATVRRLAERHPGLPEPAGRPTLVEMNQVPTEVRQELGKTFNRLPENARRQSRGKWPEFALALAEAAQRGGVRLPEPPGPARPEQMPPAIQAWTSADLGPRLSPTERDQWQALEGKWPDYPRKMAELARQHDLPVPGVTLPGKPSLWAKYYGEGRKP